MTATRSQLMVLCSSGMRWNTTRSVGHSAAVKPATNKRGAAAVAIGDAAQVLVKLL